MAFWVYALTKRLLKPMIVAIIIPRIIQPYFLRSGPGSAGHFPFRRTSNGQTTSTTKASTKWLEYGEVALLYKSNMVGCILYTLFYDTILFPYNFLAVQQTPIVEFFHHLLQRLAVGCYGIFHRGRKGVVYFTLYQLVALQSF